MKSANGRTLPEALECDFEFVRELGRGATAVVHLARGRASGETVAIKIIRPQYLDDEEALGRFAREARYASRLDHPNIVRMHEVRDLGDAGIALVMAHASGPTLREHLQARGPLPAERAESVMRDIAAALAAAHDVGIAHRDVKPENIFLEDGRALLADFGIARSMSGETQQLTMSGVAIGTPTYMAPEQIDGLELDGRGDIYSLGLTAWETLTGHRPWEGEALYAVLYHQKHTQVADVRSVRPDLSDRFASAIAGAIEKDREVRWQSAHDLLAALDGNMPPREWPSIGTQAMETMRVDRPARTESGRAVVPAAVDLGAPQWSDIAPAPKDRRLAYRGVGAGMIALALVVGGGALHARSDNESTARPVAAQSAGAIALPVDTSRAPRASVAAPARTGGPPAQRETRSEGEVERVAKARPATDLTPPPPAALAPATAPATSSGIAPGGTHTCRLAADGIATCWGGNERGQLGSVGAVRRATPAPVSETRFSTLAAGMWHSCGISRAGGATWCWGTNDRGQLGDGSVAPRAAPTRVVASRSFRQIAAGASHTCALDGDGSAWCWGANDAGQLGNGTTEDAAAPARVAHRRRLTRIVAGWRFTCALDAVGVALCWGEGASGQLGNGTHEGRREPTPVAGGLSFVSLAAGSAHACGVTAQGAAYCWGSNSGGQVGDGTSVDRRAPTRVRSTETFTSVAAGAVHSCALTAAGAAYCWGRNGYGQLGEGGTDDHAVPQRVAGGHSFTTLRAFGAHTCGTTSSGEAFCWGFNLDGQLGDGSRTHRTRPVYVERAGASRG